MDEREIAIREKFFQFSFATHIIEIGPVNCVIKIISIALDSCTKIISIIMKTVRLVPVWTDPRNLLLFDIESGQRLHLSLLWRLWDLVVDVTCDSPEKHFDDCASSSMIVYGASLT